MKQPGQSNYLFSYRITIVWSCSNCGYGYRWFKLDGVQYTYLICMLSEPVQVSTREYKFKIFHYNAIARRILIINIFTNIVWFDSPADWFDSSERYLLQAGWGCCLLLHWSEAIMHLQNSIRSYRRRKATISIFNHRNKSENPRWLWTLRMRV